MTLGSPWACRLQLGGGVGPGGRDLPVRDFEGVGRRKGDALRSASAAAWRYLQDQGYCQEPLAPATVPPTASPPAIVPPAMTPMLSVSLPGSGSSGSTPSLGSISSIGSGSSGSALSGSVASSAGVLAAMDTQGSAAATALQQRGAATEEGAAASQQSLQQKRLHEFYHHYNHNQVTLTAI